MAYMYVDNFKMAEPTTNIEDLEDGEIESDGEEFNEVQNEEKSVEGAPVGDEALDKEDTEVENVYFSKSGKKKKSKSHKSEQKLKDKNKKSRKFVNSTDEDFAGSVEKAIRKALNKTDVNEAQNDEDFEERRKHKKRKKYDGKEGQSKKRKKQDYSDEMDESEMMCVRGASPVQRQSPQEMYQDEDKDSYESDSSHDSRGHSTHRQRHRPQRDRNKNKNERRRGNHPMQDPDGVCLYFMQGKCHKGDDCIYSHDAQPPRKMELCKFYLMDCCAKRDKCLYMHADFPCKYYHTGLPCIYKEECKFAHGKPLNEGLKNILLKHIESAPKEILGDFPRLNREGAMKMIQTTQSKLIQQFSENTDGQTRNIPSLFDFNIPNPSNNFDSVQSNQFHSDRQNKVSPKVRQSRWQNDDQSSNLSPNSNVGTSNVLCIKNLNGVLTPRQISDLSKMGIENLDQLGQLTVLQLNSIGISLKQITEIQLNTMSIQKFGLINSVDQQAQYLGSNTAKDLDLRVPPAAPSNSLAMSSELPEQDIDMRFLPNIAVGINDDSSTSKPLKRDASSKDMIDIDQYTKDALKFASKDKENIDISNEGLDNEKGNNLNEVKDVDHRVLPFADSNSTCRQPDIEEHLLHNEGDTDIRFLQPEPIFKNAEKRHRRSTTDDDEDNNLLIDEKWYSSDEEKGNKKKISSPLPQKALLMSPPAPHAIEPSAVLSKLGDLSKIDISEEVTKLLNTMKNNLQDNKSNTGEQIEHNISRDPRSRRSPVRTSEKIMKSPPNKKPRVSIYECVDGEPTDGRRRTDVDLRLTDYTPSFGDTDLRQNTSGDIDLRLALPFKAMSNYTPASEINGSINSHPPIQYKLSLVHIPRPDYTDIRNSTAKSQALTDPRLRKVFRLSVEESNSDSEKPTKPVNSGPRIDPRRKPKDVVGQIDPPHQEQKSNSLDIQIILQNSSWYKDLSSTHKIFVNQNLAPITQMIKQFQQDQTPGKKLDVTPIQNNNILCSIFNNLGITLGENGEFSYLPKPKEALLKTPPNFNQNANPFAVNNNMQGGPGSMDNMNMMNMQPMGHHGNQMNHLRGFNQGIPDPRGGPTPGLLGIAPNMPHNFNNSNKFGGPTNFGNMGFNGPQGDFNYNMEGDQNFQRYPNRGGHRGRGNDRWNRGGSGRGHRDRKNFNDRGNWKNDRN
ncbi:protein suppressor of sable isoform X2 [Bicyclus anynana]|uniref:Protein suppressor of sable isoform X2 n=1 Tax=Bicyclus anynana TaxID=110368 RepID=A0A6J1MNT4_BICAN|nr:protein suppressor of sable isoform X2 [Bicyclus anynana]